MEHMAYLRSECLQHRYGKYCSAVLAIMLALFSFTCLISYYYEGETSVLYLFQGDDKAATRKVVIRIMQIVMPILIFIWGNIDSGLAWNLSDLALVDLHGSTC